MVELGLGSGYLRLHPKIFAYFFMKISQQFGINIFDTAASYGDGQGESLVGKAKNSESRVITKIGLSSQATLRTSNYDRWDFFFPARTIEEEFHRSLTRLKVQNTYALLLHCYSVDQDLKSHIDVLAKLKNSDKVKKIGFSIDSLSDLPVNYDWADIVEIPVVVLPYIQPKDGQTLVINGIFRNDKGIELLYRFVRQNPNVHVIALNGSRNIFRVLNFSLKFQSIFSDAYT
jgi:hypothetical protein